MTMAEAIAVRQDIVERLGETATPDLLLDAIQALDHNGQMLCRGLVSAAKRGEHVYLVTGQRGEEALCRDERDRVIAALSSIRDVGALRTLAAFAREIAAGQPTIRGYPQDLENRALAAFDASLETPGVWFPE